MNKIAIWISAVSFIISVSISVFSSAYTIHNSLIVLNEHKHKLQESSAEFHRSEIEFKVQLCDLDYSHNLHLKACEN